MQTGSESASVSVEGHVRIVSYGDDGAERVELDKRNAVHKENLSIAIAKALGGQKEGRIYTMSFGTGGATVNNLDEIVYASPNVSGAADLNIPVYSEVVDALRGAPTGNRASVRHVAGTTYTDIEIRCIIEKNEPAGQVAFDNITTDLSGDFVFDEIGLKTDDGLLLTHICFSPIQKASNRVIDCRYVLRIKLT